MSTPHLAVPFRLTHRGAATVEQDSSAEIAQCVQTAASYRIGQLDTNPEFGITDPVFDPLVDVDRLADEIRAVEPRFTGRIERAIVDPITQAVTLTVAEEI
jgi:hypothetical protein